MSERPYVWHESKFQTTHTSNPWTVTFGRPKHVNDFKHGHSAATLEAAMNMAVKLAMGEGTKCAST